ncbi:MAG TPA: SH3 domain-containing protein [Stellaceae bacterium]|nr:SH3 domain-containing protein [Stellaceae bacterium]
MPVNNIVRLPATVAILMAAAPLAAGTAAARSYIPYTEHIYPTTRDCTPNHAVFLRAAPTTDARVLGILRPGVPLRVTATANYGWMRVRSPEGTGWAYGSYLTPD